MSLRKFSPCTLFAHKVPVANPLTIQVELKPKRAQNFSSDSLLNISSKEHTARKYFPMPSTNKQEHIRCKTIVTKPLFRLLGVILEKRSVQEDFWYKDRHQAFYAS